MRDRRRSRGMTKINLLPSEKNPYRWLGLGEIVETQTCQGRGKEAMETYKLIEPDAVRDLAARRFAVLQEKAATERTWCKRCDP